MPHWLVKLLESDGEVKIISRLSPRGRLEKVKSTNHAEGIVPVLAQLLEQDPLTKIAYLCHPSVKHVSKLRREGQYHSPKGPKYLLTDSRRLLWLPKHSNVDFLY